MAKPILAAWLSIVAFAFLCSLAEADAPLVGVLEDVPGVQAGEANRFAVRVLFRKAGERWIAFPSNCVDLGCLEQSSTHFSGRIGWTATFDGKALGKVEARTPTIYNYYSEIGLQDVVNKGAVPTIGSRSTVFGGFQDAAVYRPLVAISIPRFEDPEHWKLTRGDAALFQRLRGLFREKYPTLCRTDEQDETKSDAFPYRDKDVEVTKAYASSKGWIVAGLHLGQAESCKDTEAGFGMNDPWFVISPNGSARYLDSGIWLVDAGDYDLDGKSELVFAISRYNRGGYELFYENFAKRAVFQYGYH